MTLYKVQLDSYSGPLDLLLYLIRQQEVDIYDIPIASLTHQYVQYVDLLKELDPDGVSEYLVLLATLIETKSRMLLPQSAVEDEELEDLEDPRIDLVRKLLEYKRFKDAARELGEAAEEHAKRFPPRPCRIEHDPSEQELDEVQVWDLLAAFNHVMSQIGRTPAVHEVLYDDTPLALHAADIQDRLQREEGSLSFERIFLGRARPEVIGLFLALLELIRQKRVRARQEGLFGMIVIQLLDEAPLEIAEDRLDDAHATDSLSELDDALQADDPPDGEEVDTPFREFDDEDEETDRELDAIDRALDQVADRLEADRRQRRDADDGTEPGGSS